MRRAAAVLALSGLTAALYAFGVGAKPMARDEAEFDSVARNLNASAWHNQGGRFPPVFISNTNGEWLHAAPIYATAVVRRLTDAVAASRWFPVVLGTIDIVLIYLVARAGGKSHVFAMLAAALLLCSPAHLDASRRAARDGIWDVPILMVWMWGLLSALSARTDRARLAWWMLAGAALAGALYAQPSAPLIVVGLAGVSGVVVWRTPPHRRSALVAMATGAAILIAPMAVWYVRYPETYPDTLGRWLLHSAHIRSPGSWLAESFSRDAIAGVVHITWDWLSPTHLFVNSNTPGWAGVFPATLAPLMVIGAADRKSTSWSSGAWCQWLPAYVLIATPILVATFKQPRATELALIVVPAGVLLAAGGAEAMWRRSRRERLWAVLLLIVAGAQFAAYYKAVLASH